MKELKVTTKSNMSHLKEYIKEENEAARDYNKLAMKKALEKKTLKGIAKDEKHHAKQLKRMEKKEKE